MSIYNAASHVELRHEVIALCMEAIDEARFNSGLPKLTCAQRIVPKIPEKTPIAWAVIDKRDGVYITYRADFEDAARKCAVHCDQDWPMDAPHVVVPVYREVTP